MIAETVFKTLVEPTLERIPVLEAVYREKFKDREFIVTQTVQRNVFTDFDRKLSRHLAAIRGAGFPAFTVTVRASERGGAASGRALGSTHHPSVPHALREIAARACGEKGKASITIDYGAPGAASSGGLTRSIDSETVSQMEAALQICEALGEAEFLEISGDFDVVIAQPPGDLKPLVAHLQNGSASLPCPTGATVTTFECPIYGFATHAGTNVMAQGYLATARHGLVSAKEAAVGEFRAAAEERILSFDRALGRWPLTGHRLDAATALVGRLKAGLGEALAGLSEDAKITALDWSAAIRAGDGTGSRPGSTIVTPHPVAEAV